jgi:formate hydrogenlyase transcriptional activator
VKLESLQSIMLAVAQARSVNEVLERIVNGVAECSDVALVRIWLVAPGDVCDECRFRSECPDRERCLHLAASAGSSRHNDADFSRLDGAFRRFPLGVRKIGRVAKTGEPLLLPGVRGDEEWIAEPRWMEQEAVRTFAAQPLLFRGEVLGVLALFDRGVLSEKDFEWLRTFADHAAVAIANARAFEEIESLQARLEKENSHLREEFHDLFNEAPIAYVHEELDSRIIRANRAAMTMLGLTPEDIPGTYGKSLIANNEDARRRVSEAFESVGRGTDTSGVVLEMRRKDNGKPLWVQWWSRPAPNGKYTRTMVVDITERMLLEREQARLQAQNDYLWEEIRSEHNFGDLIGKSPGLRKVMQQIQLVAPTDAAVLVTGESGTGKELVARAIHENSPRKSRALIKVNCGAVPEALFESEFFGHARGAFTGALKDKPGRFELADGGTIFLDEIGEVPLAMQAKLLRVLQEQEIERVGDTRTRKISVRIIAATNRDLKKEVEAGRFRQDLFYRLSVFPIEIPPLRERREDIAPLTAHFLKQSARRMNRPVPRVTEATINQLAAHDWFGNVRELQNAVERAVILSQGRPLSFDLAEPASTENSRAISRPAEPTRLFTREELKHRERENITAALRQSGGKVFGANGAASLLGMKPTTLASKVKALGLSKQWSWPPRVWPDLIEAEFAHCFGCPVKQPRAQNQGPGGSNGVVDTCGSLASEGAPREHKPDLKFAYGGDQM